MLVTNSEKRNHERFSDCLRKRSLSIARGSNKKDFVARLKAVRSELISPKLLLYQVIAKPTDELRKNEIAHPTLRSFFDEKGLRRETA